MKIRTNKDIEIPDPGWKSYEPNDYLDRRRGLAVLFNYCHLCGKKINWTEIKKRNKRWNFIDILM